MEHQVKHYLAMRCKDCKYWIEGFYKGMLLNSGLGECSHHKFDEDVLNPKLKSNGGTIDDDGAVLDPGRDGMILMGKDFGCIHFTEKMKDFSQHGEQMLILNYFSHSPNGTFLDIGANDGVTFSNTYALFLMGWAGALVDASPKAYKAMERNFASFKRKPEIIHAAITTQDGTVTLHEASDTLVSSLNATAEETWRHHGFEWTPVQVPAMTVDTLYAVLGTNEFDFVSVDAEGHDLDIVRQLHLDPVKMLCVEYGKHKREIIKACKGFKVLLDNGVNVILAR